MSQLQSSTTEDKTIFYTSSPDHYCITDWSKVDGSYIKEGEGICTVEAYPAPFACSAPSSGYLQRLITENADIQSSTERPIFALYHDEKSWLASRYSSMIKAEIDPKTGAMTAGWEYIGMPHPDLSDYYRAVLSSYKKNDCLKYGKEGKMVKMRIVNTDGKDYILFGFSIKEYKYGNTDKLSVLMSNGENLLFRDGNENPIGADMWIRFPLYFEYLSILSESQVKSIRVSVTDTDKYHHIKVADESENEASAPTYFQYIYKDAIDTYLKYLNQIASIYKPSYKPKETKRKRKDRDVRKGKYYVFLIQDTDNGYCQFGVSDKLWALEAEWQREFPTIKIIAKKDCPSEKLASALGNGLYMAFQENKVGEEWFELDEQDIHDLLLLLRS